MATSYIGADVDCKMTEIAIERNQKVVMRDRISTDIKTLREFLATVSGKKGMVIEEGAMSGWLYRNLCGHVDRFVVCDPRRNRVIYDDGEKTDSIDAADLARLCRGGLLREVYHATNENRLALKETVALYHDRVRDAVRQINKLRDSCREYGLRIPLKAPAPRRAWLAPLGHQDLSKRLSILWIGFDAVTQKNNPFATYYDGRVQDGMTPNNARHAVARKLLTVMWGMWKTNSRYDSRLV